MRLSPKEIQIIKSSFSSCLQMPYKLYLFGSRVDDKKKGGDIDLLVVVENTSAKDIAVSKKNLIRHAIFDTLPEQKIDITVATFAELNQVEFLKEIKKTCVELM